MPRISTKPSLLIGPQVVRWQVAQSVPDQFFRDAVRDNVLPRKTLCHCGRLAEYNAQYNAYECDDTHSTPAANVLTGGR